MHTLSDKSVTTRSPNTSLLFNLKLPLKYLAVTPEMFHIRLELLCQVNVDFEAPVNKIKKKTSSQNEM